MSLLYQNSISAVTTQRPVPNKLDDTISILDFGNDLAGIQAAVDSSKKVLFPSGNYVVSGEITCTPEGIHFAGDGATITGFNGTGFRVTGGSVTLEGDLTYDGCQDAAAPDG